MWVRVDHGTDVEFECGEGSAVDFNAFLMTYETDLTISSKLLKKGLGHRIKQSYKIRSPTPASNLIAQFTRLH